MLGAAVAGGRPCRVLLLLEDAVPCADAATGGILCLSTLVAGG